MAAYMKDINTLIAAGFDPKTGLPLKFVESQQPELKSAIKRTLRIVDEQDAIRRFNWVNMPDGLEDIIERVLYYKGQGMFFYMEANSTFYFLPYALNGSIDVYGRYTGVTPLPFYGAVDSEKKPKAWIQGLVKKPIYSIQLDDFDYDMITDSCVLLSDYCKQISQTTLPRQQLNDPILDFEAELIPFMRTALQNQTGISAVRVNNQDEQANVQALNSQVQRAALTGQKFLAAVGTIEMQELSEAPIGRAADYMQALESVDNFRLGLYGLENGGIFQKKAHMLEAEQAMSGSGSSTGLVFQDSLAIRQRFCDIVNSIWGLGIWCLPSENQVGDLGQDGIIGDEDLNGTESNPDNEGGSLNE